MIAVASLTFMKRADALLRRRTAAKGDSTALDGADAASARSENGSTTVCAPCRYLPVRTHWDSTGDTRD